MPPSHCNKDRQINRPSVIASKSVIMVDPVVVIPDIDSKIASVKENPKLEI